MVYHSFTWDHLKPRYAELGLNERTAFGCILNYLFRPKPTAQAFISDYTSVMSLPTVFTVGLQIRTGDMSMKDPEYDEQNTVDLHNNFFRCANELAETYARKDQRVLYYLVTGVYTSSCRVLSACADMGAQTRLISSWTLSERSATSSS